MYFCQDVYVINVCGARGVSRGSDRVFHLTAMTRPEVPDSNELRPDIISAPEMGARPDVVLVFPKFKYACHSNFAVRF